MLINIKLAWKYLWTRKTRTILTTLSIAFGVMIIFGLNALMPSMLDVFTKSIMKSANLTDLSICSKLQGTIEESYLMKVKSYEGVKIATGVIEKEINVNTIVIEGVKKSIPLELKGIEPEILSEISKIDFVSGSMFMKNSSVDILIPEELSKKANIGVGDVLTLPTAKGVKDYKISGVYKDASIAGTMLVYMNLKEMQTAYNLDGRLSSIEVLFKPDTNKKSLKEKILADLGGDFREGTNAKGQEFTSVMEMTGVIFNFFGIITLIMSGFIIFITFRTIVLERLKDIGVLRTVGATKKNIVILVITEGLLQGFIGTLLGIFLGYFMSMIIISLMNPIMEEFMKIKLEFYKISLKDLITPSLLGIGISVISGLIPAINAGRLTPLEALRQNSIKISRKSSRFRLVAGLISVFISLFIAVFSKVSGRIEFGMLGVILLAIGFVFLGPSIISPLSVVFEKILNIIFYSESKVARGSIESNPKRTSATFITVMIGLALVLSIVGLYSSLNSTINELIDKNFGADYMFLPESLVLGTGNIGASPDLINKIKSVQGVEEATGIRTSFSLFKDNNVQVIGIEPLVYRKLAGFVFSAGEPEDAVRSLSEGRYAIVNGIMAGTRNIKLGETITLGTPSGNKDYVVSGIAMDLLNAKIETLYISHENLKADFHETTDVMLLVNGKKDFEKKELENSLNNIVQQYPMFSLKSSKDFKAQMRQTVNKSMMGVLVMLIFVVIPSLIALANTIGIGVMERIREIGVMRAVGATKKQIKRIVTAESILVASIGMVLSIIVGIWLGYVIVGLANIKGFKVVYSIPLYSLFVTLFAGVILGIAGAYFPARYAAKINVVEALHHE